MKTFFLRLPLRSTRASLAASRNRRPHLSLVLPLLLAAFAVPAAAQGIEGRVVEQATLQPVAGAAVELLDAAGAPVATASSDAAGAFQVQAPAPGEFRLRVTREGLRTTVTRAVPVGAGQVLAVEVRMAPPVVEEPVVVTMPAERGISGRVLDAQTEQPLPSATVTLLNPREQRVARVVTDSLGRFRMRVSEPNGYSLRAERVGYRAATSGVITVTPDDTVVVELRLSTQAVVLAPLTVVAASSQVMRDHQLAGFQFRRERQPFGRYLGPEEIERINPFYASDVLQQVPMVQVHGGFTRVVTLPARGRGMGARARCIPNLYVDGQLVRLDSELTIDQMVTGKNVAAVEVYSSPSSAPGEFPPRIDPFCGVVVIWTRVVRDDNG
ncbi:MAG TPA: carboxypeptidase-like regulatory domain-containing protein [Longimicrobium sp.]|nr:carboxypeptidase-like regulatory domain-containing protein [Longimicrobium sp.]